MFSKPDYFVSKGASNCTSACVSVNTGFAWNHGDYAPEINTTWTGFVGPGIAHLGLDGNAPNAGPSSAGPNSGQGTIPETNITGTWTDHTDIRPTLLSVLGLHDDYTNDGRVISEILQHPNSDLSRPGVTSLGACYKQLNSSVGEFGTSTLEADTAAIQSSSTNDATYTSTVSRLRALEVVRDAIAQSIKTSLDQAAFNNRPVSDVAARTFACNLVIAAAGVLAR
jgi:hypothetical protein